MKDPEWNILFKKRHFATFNIKQWYSGQAVQPIIEKVRQLVQIK